MAHPNIDLMRQADEAMARGDIEEFFAYYADDAVFHVPGTSRLSGDFAGLEQITGLFGQFMEAMGEYSFENHAYLADDEHGVVLQRGKSVKDGQTKEWNEVFVLHFRDGKISEMWFIPLDLAAVEALIGS